MLDLGGNFISDKFKMFCKSLNIKQIFLPLYHHLGNGQVEACIKFIKCMLRKCFDIKYGQHIALLQIWMTPLELGLPSLATMLFNCPIGGIIPIISRPPISINNDVEHYKVPVNRHKKMIKIKVLPKIMFLFQQDLLYWFNARMGDHRPMVL